MFTIVRSDVVKFLLFSLYQQINVILIKINAKPSFSLHLLSHNTHYH